jgi:hypothetical protein
MGERETPPRPGTGVMNWPESNVVLFAFLLNLPWELWQIPLFKNMPSLAHWDGVILCTRAALGDAAIALPAFWLVAAVAGTRDWIRRPTGITLGAFVAIGPVVIYTCPMHPKSARPPGNCPKCGMALEPVLPALDDDENPELVDFRAASGGRCR